MKFSDLSLKAKFDVAVMSVFGTPSKVLSKTLYADDYETRLEFTKMADQKSYSGQVIFRKDVKSYLGGGVKRTEVISKIPNATGGVALEDIPHLIEQWQETMEMQGWKKSALTVLGAGAEYQAVAYKKGVKL